MNAALLAGLTLFVTGNLAQGQVLASDKFSYAGLLTTNGWNAFSGSGSKALMANGSTVTLDQSLGAGEDAELTFGAQSATDTTYASFTLNVPSGNPVNPDGDGLYFILLKDSGFAYRARTGVMSPAGGGDYGLAINADNAALGAGAVWPSDLIFDVDYCVVFSWDAATASSQLWINPADSSSASIMHTGVNVGTIIEAVALRQSNDYTGFITVDNVRAGKTFADVTGMLIENTGTPGCDCSAGNPSCASTSAVGSGCPNSVGPGAILTAAGHAEVGVGDTFRLSVSGGSPGDVGLIFSGTTSMGPIYTLPNSAGGLCSGGTTQRSDIYQMDGTGAVFLPTFDLSIGGGAYGAASGTGFQTYQFWYRDPGGAAGCTTDIAGSDFNFTNGWNVTWL